jgi:hypothetical protein
MAEVGVSRRARVIVVSAAVVVAAGLAAGKIVASRSVGQLVAEGRVTATDGRPASGIKVWLNAWPGGVARQQGPVDVVTSAITSASGVYTIRVPSAAALAPDAANGVVSFLLMAGNSSGWDEPRFRRDVVTSAGGFGPAVLAIPRGGSLTVNLRLTPGLHPVASGATTGRCPQALEFQPMVWCSAGTGWSPGADRGPGLNR